MKNITKILVVVALIGGTSSFGTVTKKSKIEKSTQHSKWEELGSRKVNMVADHDEILITASQGFFTLLKFKVLDAPILVRNVKVIFGNGDYKNVKVNKKFIEGAESRPIDLPGNKRIIKKIIMNYTSVANHKGKATVVVFGKH